MDRLLALCIAIPVYGLLAVPFVLIDKRPELLTPQWKLAVSLLIIGIGFVIPLFLPEVLTGFSPLNQLEVELLYPVFAVPQGFVGAGCAYALMQLKLSQQARRDLNHLWWIVSMFGVLWTTGAIFLTGLTFAGWVL